jgi:tRNA pseudouridine55 synthase
MMDGILNINKPTGKTSFNIVAIVKRLSGEKRVGHAGTLDPAATGVLPVCLGQGTRVVEYLMDATKVYRAEVELGTATDTHDASGQVTQQGEISGINLDRLESVLDSFTGIIHQTPPMYSAVKYQGKPLYKLAREGITVERESRPVKIYDLQILDWQSPFVTLEIVCSKGTYIRSLAHDLGQLLGCGAHLKSLVRLRCGPFTLEDSISVPRLEEAFQYGYWQQYMCPIDSVLLHWAAMVVNDEESFNIINGRPVIQDDINNDDKKSCLSPGINVEFDGNLCRAYALDGRFLGVLRFNTGKKHWQPEKVFFRQVPR